jgi:type IV secretory pathway VirB10-like protein
MAPIDQVAPEEGVQIDTPPPVEHDRHAPKLPANHPSLRLPRPRMLNKARVLAAVFCVTGVVAASLVMGFVPSEAREQMNRASLSEPGAQVSADTDNLAVPDALRNAPDNRSPLRPAVAVSPDRTDEDELFASALAGSGPSAKGRQGPRASTSRGRQDSAFDEGPPSRSPEVQARLDQAERARSGPIACDVAIPGTDSKPSDAASGTAPATLVAPGAAGSPSVLGSSPASEPDTNRQAEKHAFRQQNGWTSGAYVTDRLAAPLSPYELKAGSIIPATLITAINSDLPGEVVAQVRENVYDTVTGNHLLVPQGSRLLARVDSAISYGQERVLLCWSRLIRPDGSSINLECAPGVDLAGQAGFADQVDNHWRKLITGVVLSSLLSATTQAVAGSTQGFQPSLPQLWAAGAAGEVNAVGQQFTKKNLGIQPTIKIRAGFGVNVLVSKDLILAPYRGL